jgi:methyl-accepting chemotaxis protein
MKLSILAKLNAILVALSIPIVILLYLFVQETNVNINFGQKEIYGDDYLKTTRKILDNVTQLSSAIVRNRKYNLDSKENINTIQDKISADLKELEAVQKKYSGTFEFKNSSDKVNSFVNKWKLVHDQAFKGSVEDETDRYNSIVAELRNLIVYVGNESNLILDPDLDTYYLMDFTLLKHPSISDLVYQLETLTQKIAGAKSITADEKTQLVVLSGLITSDLGNSRIDINTAYENTKDPEGLKKALEQATVAHQNAVKAALNFVDNNFLKKEEITTPVAQVGAIFGNALKAGHTMFDAVVKSQDALMQARIDRFNSSKLMRVIFAVIVTIVLLVFGIIQILSIVKSIRKLEDAAKKVSAGEMDIDVDIKSGDELETLAASFTSMVKNINNAIGTIETNSLNLESLIRETTTSVSQIKQTSDIVSDNARIVADASSVAVTISEEGQRAVNESIDGVKKIKEQIESIAEKIIELNSKTQVITRIISAVDDITKQSKILAFNASIEASKAGDAGKGFAVVANEIKNLSEESKESTRKISEIINEIQELTNTVVMMTEQGSKIADQGFTLSQLAGETIEKLAFSIQNSSEAAFQISSSAIEQKTGMEQLEETMRNASI